MRNLGLMATWKERGEVPDSDDDDISDSQSIASDVELEAEPDTQPLPYLKSTVPTEILDDKDIQNAVVDQEPFSSPLSDLESEEESNELEAVAQIEFPGSPLMKDSIASLAETVETDPDVVDEQENVDSIMNSPLTPQSSFKIPEGLETQFHDEDHATPRNYEVNPGAEEDFPSIEEISRTYVRLSPQQSRHFSPPMEYSIAESSNDVPRENLQIQMRQELANDTGPSYTELEHILMHESQEQLEHRRRNLRERKAIQMHPYLVEQQKYRQSLKARGITPMRIENTPAESMRRNAEEAPQSSGTQDEHFQSSATQDDAGSDQPDSSQLRPLEWDSIPSSIPNGPVQSNDDENDENDDDQNDIRNGIVNEQDDEDGLPSIAELTQSTHLASKSRLKTYSAKRTRLGLPRVSTQPLLRQNARNKSYDPFDLPDSPPVTSSPRPRSTSKNLRRSNSLAMTISSKEPTPSLPDEDQIEFQYPPEMPTPATSVTKPASVTEILQIDSSSEDDPFSSVPAEEPDQSSSSSDESIEIRRIGKRLGGVLPASHLRLVQQQQKPAPKPRYKKPGRSVSNVQSPALQDPISKRRPLHIPNTEIPLFSDDESASESNMPTPTMRREFVYEDAGSAEEDDRIDAMLPSRDRQMKMSSGTRKRKRPSSASMFGKRHDGLRQMKMTDSVHRSHSINQQEGGRPRKRKKYSSKRSTTEQQANSRANIPRLGILDVIDVSNPTSTSRPNFIRIAARTAKKRKDQGRQSPTKKFIRLANREDTLATQVTLTEWKSGTIRPRELSHQNKARQPLAPLDLLGNSRPSCPSLLPANRPLQQKQSVQRRERRPLMVISRDKQVSLDPFLTADRHDNDQNRESWSAHQALHSIRRRRNGLPRHEGPLARPAQLESTVSDYQYQHPVAAFKTTKRALDALYRSRKRKTAGQTNVQLNRFLADEDNNISMGISLPQAERSTIPNVEPVDIHRETRLHPRKSKPTRLDAGAAIYRQPSEPLILNYLVPTKQDTGDKDGKLFGLRKLGTNYPRHFDVLPMQSGVFFHESTFIGSGRLSAAIKFSDFTSFHNSRSNFTFQLGDNRFRWGVWDDKVSSEIGVCFDLLTEYLGATASTDTVSRSVEITHIMTCIIDYTQNHLSFASSQDEEKFIIRMLEIFQDVFARMDGPDNESRNCIQPTIQFLVKCVVLALQILKISRTQKAQLSLSCQVEDQLQRFGRLAAQYLMVIGLDPLRNIYDDLQYLSVRERGIRDNHHVIQAWVILWKALDAANIPRGSFWDIVYTQLPEVELGSLDDARTMEKIWFSIFTLLPLSEFDEAGVLNPFTRFRVSWDNWSLPQQLLKRVFSLYAFNARQPPGFNDYCRALLGRCHYLIREWGWWKCSGLIGTIFDFFAAERLAHLRNEEVYKSPRFLEELYLQPSLEVDPEDRCFHIFLKIVALVIKHMRHVEDFKSIRNLVARLLPNHDRQYPKEQAIHHRELASLRNHHDLLCTLFWAAPPDLRPSVVLIQNLVVADESHKEACLTNLQAWLNIARFVLLHTPDSMLSEVYEPLAAWQSTQFLKILKQYDEAETDIRKQVEQLRQQSKTGYTEAELKATIKTNRQTTMSTVKAFMDAVHSLFSSLPQSPSLLQITTPANLETFAALFSIRTSPFGAGWDTAMIVAGVNFVQEYLIYLAKADPECKRTDSVITPDEDSQDFGSIDVDDWDFDNLGITPVRNTILPAVRNAIRQALYSAGQDALQLGTPQQVAMSKLTVVWAMLASISIQKESFQPSDFLLGSQNALFNDRHVTSRNPEKHVLVAAAQWPLFLGILVKNTQSVFPDVNQRSSTSNEIQTFNVGMEWMTALAKPVEKQYHEHQLTAALYEQNFFLLRGLGEWPVDIATVVANSDFNLLCLRTAIDNMNKLLSDSQRREMTHKNRSLQEVKEEFSQTLRKVLKVMEVELRQMSNLSAPPHQSYVTFVQEVAKRIRSHAKDILPLPDFFVHSSVYFWPDQSDPTYQLASLRAYAIRLGKSETGATWETFHYLYNTFKRALLEGDLDSYIQKVRKAAKAWPFFQFIIDNMIPAAVHVGFSDELPLNAISWTLCAATFPIIRQSPMTTSPFEYFIEGSRYGNDEGRAEHTYQCAVRLLKLIITFLRKRITTRAGQPLNSDSRGILSLVCQLGDYLIPAMTNYVASFSEKADPIIDTFSTFMGDARSHMEDPHSTYSILSDPAIQDFMDPSPFAKVIYSDMLQWAVTSSQHDTGDISRQDVELSELIVKIPDHGNLREVNLTALVRKLPKFHEVLRCANILTVGESQFTSKRVPVQQHDIDSNALIASALDERDQKFCYRDTPRSRILMTLSNF